MLDLGFSEMMLIAMVALVVLGPERLPRVARTVGHLVGRMQRYVSDVKSDITREMELDELRKFRQTMEETATSVQSSFTELESDARAVGNDLEALSRAQARGEGEAAMPALDAPSDGDGTGTDFSIAPPSDAASTDVPVLVEASVGELARPSDDEWVEPTVSGAMASIACVARYSATAAVAMSSDAVLLRGDRRWPMPEAATMPAARPAASSPSPSQPVAPSPAMPAVTPALDELTDSISAAVPEAGSAQAAAREA